MKKYKVIVSQHYTYEDIEAESPEQAEDMVYRTEWRYAQGDISFKVEEQED